MPDLFSVCLYFLLKLIAQIGTNELADFSRIGARKYVSADAKLWYLRCEITTSIATALRYDTRPLQVIPHILSVKLPR